MGRRRKPVRASQRDREPEQLDPGGPIPAPVSLSTGDPVRRVVEGLEGALRSLERLGQTQGQLLERLERHRRGGGWGILGTVMLGMALGGLGTLGWQQVAGRGEPFDAAVAASARTAEGAPASVSGEEAAGEDLSSLERRVTDLESAGRAAASLSLLGDAAPAPAAGRSRALPPFVAPRPLSAAPQSPVALPWSAPAADSPTEASIEDVEGSEPEPGPEEETLAGSAEVPPAPGTVLTSPPATYPTEQLCRTVNRLLHSAGMDEYLLLEASASVGDHELHDVVLVSRAPDGTRLSSIRASAMALRFGADTGGFLELRDARGQMSGMGVEYPDHRLSIPIPGLLQGDTLEHPLGQLFGTDPSRWVSEGTTPLERLNHVLGDVEHLPYRVRAIGQEGEEGHLQDVVLDLAFATDRSPSQSLHAKKLWWELHPVETYVEVCAEGGVMGSEEHLRPLFRGRFRKILRNVNVEAWRGLPGVVEVP